MVLLGKTLLDEIEHQLFSIQDKKYCEFQSKLIPNVGLEKFIGVRTPQLRRLAKSLIKKNDVHTFLRSLPHYYFDENQLHAFIISELRDYKSCMYEINFFLPFVDNWATCDQMSPGILKKYKNKLLIEIKNWLASGRVYTIRFGIVMLMRYFLDQDFNIAYARILINVISKDYYVNMAIAWFFATALAKHYESILPILEQKRLDIWVHNKTIQKAIESKRIAQDQKIHLRSLKI